MMQGTRIEKDSLGTKNIPKEAYYGIQTVRAKENFPITGEMIDTDLIRALGVVKKAAALANHKVGNLSTEFKDAIVQASNEVNKGNFNEQFVTDPIQGGAGTSINMNANEVIANRALEILGHEKGEYSYLSPNTHVNMAQSTNDAFPSAFRLALLLKNRKLLKHLDDLINAFEDKAKEFDDVIKMGRTHLQDAVPIRLGQEFQAYATALRRGYDRIARSAKLLEELNMGATAVGTGLNADTQYIKYVIEEIADHTGFDITSSENLVDGTQNTDGYAEYSAALKVTMLSLSKIANDLRLMASGPRSGLAEINLPAVQPGSSIMPGKVNPVMLEVTNQVAFRVIGNDATVSTAVEAGQFELNVMEPVLAYSLLQSQEIMTNVFKVVKTNCIEGITANKERLEDYVHNSIGPITAVNPHIGYEKASEIASEALETGKPLRDIVLERGIMTETQIDNILDPFSMTEPGISKKIEE